MTSQPTQIQALIQQIDSVLSRSGPGLLWGLSSEAQQQRAVLMRTREYLVTLLQAGAGRPVGSGSSLGQYAQGQVPAADSAQQVLQAVMQEMSYLRTNVMQPLRSDLEQLQQQRSTLQEEVRQLEAQRQQYRLPPVNQQLMEELMRSLTDRIQERLSAQITQMGGLSADSTETDQYVLKLDSSLRVMFDSLQADLQSYQRSLSASLEKMHTLGQQSEALFAALVNRLAQQLGRETSGYLRPTEGEEVQIDRLLSELGLPNSTASTSSPPQLSMPPQTDNLLNIDLPLNLSQPTPDEEVTLFQVDPATAPAVDEEITVFQVDPQPSSSAIDPPVSAAPADAEPTADLDNFYESLFGDRAVPYTGEDESPNGESVAADPLANALPDSPLSDNAPPVDLEALFADSSAAESSGVELSGEQLDVAPTEPQSLESFLFTPEPDAVSTAEPAPELEEPDSIESIRSLSELIEPEPIDAPASAEPIAVSPVVPTIDADAEDTYIPALPEEDLLGSQDAIEQAGLMQLDDNTLQQLSSDLSNLEGLDLSAELAIEPSAPAPDLTLDELFGSSEIPSTEPPSVEATPEPELSAEADLLDLFEESARSESDAPEGGEAIEPENSLDLFGDAPELPPTDAELRDLLDIHTPPDSPPDLPPDAPPQPPIPPPDLPPDLPIPPAAIDTVAGRHDRASILAADVDDLFPLTVTPAEVELPAISLTEDAVEDVIPTSDAILVEPLEQPEPLDAIEPSESLEDLASLFAESPSLEESQAAGTTESIDAGLSLEDLFAPTMESVETPADPLTLDDFVQMPPIDRQPEMVESDATEPEVFDAEDLDALFAESEAEIAAAETPVTPTIEEQALLGDLLFDTPDLPEPLAPEEAGLTLDSFTESIDVPATESIDSPPPDQAESALFAPSAFELDEPEASDALTLEDFFNESPAVPAPETDVDPLPDDLPPEDNAFSLEGLDRLFEEAPDIEPPDEKKNAVAAQSLTTDAPPTEAIGGSRPTAYDSEAIERLLAPLQLPTSEGDPEADTLPLEPASPEPSMVNETSANVWSLGLDIGTTGISAVLLNRLSCELFPVYWAEGEERTFRLPARVYCSEDGAGAIASRETTRIALTSLRDEPSAHGARLLQNFKPDLRLGIPHYSPQTGSWEPVVQWSDQQTVSLSVIHQGLQTLLVTLSTQRSPVTAAAAPLSCGAVGLETSAFQTALQQLAQVIVGYPINCPDTYSLNIREAVLGARLVAHPEQVCFVEDAIAAILSGLRSADGRSVVLPSGLAQKSQLHNTDWQGGTLAISAGAIATEFALVNLPANMADGYPLDYRDFAVRSLPYGGNAIDQDIICQLLHPARFRQPRRPANRNLLSANFTLGAPAERDRDSATRNRAAASDRANWQTDPALGTWESLGLSDLPLPLPGEPDLANRLRLQQHLESSPLGQNLLEAARHLKLILQHQDQFTLELGDQQWRLTRQDLGSQVILPYIQRLNRELNALLAATGIPLTAIAQVVCTGGTGSLRAIARWLRQKLPNATIIQDTYARAGVPLEARSLTCSRIAYGLATLPLHPQVLDLPRQQYSDYFLLLELLRSFPDQPLSIGSIMQMLERRGINTQACHGHILALLEGHLPPGLVPTDRDDPDAPEPTRLAPVSRQNPEYAALLAAPLFHKLDAQTYQPNPEQWSRFQQYLGTLTASTHQTLTEPLTMQLG
ncbi:hypothetical protein H6F67_18050 [Microcoleus sp. FACHB-1515]|uniref:hypothetical protein n=1 Tax=Cyanophyceae TaxID=3028117 RepID=UPI001682968F|nr:hypothetical protein [Microcoleus sp. FACHB-1515]MBD2091750.1 hypothetical protein [Microcoleus sp. FACHB-1515]